MRLKMSFLSCAPSSLNPIPPQISSSFPLLLGGVGRPERAGKEKADGFETSKKRFLGGKSLYITYFVSGMLPPLFHETTKSFLFGISFQGIACEFSCMNPFSIIGCSPVRPPAWAL